MALIRALRLALPSPRYLITTALPAGEWALRNIPLYDASQSLDLINLMAYDYVGPWGKRSGHQAALYPAESTQGASSTSPAIEYVLSKHIPSRKILLGIPIYGWSFLKAKKPGEEYDGMGGHQGSFEYRHLPRTDAPEQVDDDACAAFCVGGDGGFVTYDNPTTVTTKAKYVQNMKLGGLFYWSATKDAPGSRSLIYSGYKTLHHTS